MAVRFDQDLSNLEANVSIFFPSPMPYLTPHTPPQLKHSHPGGKVTFKSPGFTTGVQQPEQLEAPGF